MNKVYTYRNSLTCLQGSGKGLNSWLSYPPAGDNLSAELVIHYNGEFSIRVISKSAKDLYAAVGYIPKHSIASAEPKYGLYKTYSVFGPPYVGWTPHVGRESGLAFFSQKKWAEGGPDFMIASIKASPLKIISVGRSWATDNKVCSQPTHSHLLGDEMWAGSHCLNFKRFIFLKDKLNIWGVI